MPLDQAYNNIRGSSMGILARFIFFEILKTLFPVWFALGFLLFVLEWLGNVFSLKATPQVIFQLYLYKAPSHLQVVFPVAVVSAVIIVLGAMNRSREVVAAQSVGYRPINLILPVLAAIGLASTVDYLLLDQISPWGMRRHYEI